MARPKFYHFLGCIIPHRYPSIEKATRLVFEDLGVELLDMVGATCCPAPGVFGSFDRITWASIAARNLTIAEEGGHPITTGCNGCFASLWDANHELKEDEELRARVNENLAEIDREFKGTIEVTHYVDALIQTVGLEKIRERVTRPLTGVRMALHPGCHWMRPRALKQKDDSERPHIFRELCETTGAEYVHYKDELMCCGAGGAVRTADLKVSLDFTKQKFESILAAGGADVIVTPCPFCELQLDLGQVEIQKHFDVKYEFDVLHVMEFLALAFGYEPDEFGLKTHLQYMQRKSEPHWERLGLKA
ncbi:MAG TPA: CoB--CoM heterodisulfide reductase subunit B [Candidatus Thorarchaeota archaeon]|nr:MAG: CoB--CoM heterodisulfide reductase subunit B [Candidatus Thorarchaeota archaeon]RLI62681.1 MAG: CoB--CoM heterodisulfide reductase subunit B [Candidatus Thorarchaeota archaeon]HDD67587.1 CoB--CoM heterodisulfide reductase subunit B [Candidatus Thorarchaeota archaeon]